MLTDKEIEDIALKYTRLCGGHWEHEEAIPDGNILDFARAIEKAVLFAVRKPLLECTKNTEQVNQPDSGK